MFLFSSPFSLCLSRVSLRWIDEKVLTSPTVLAARRRLGLQHRLAHRNTLHRHRRLQQHNPLASRARNLAPAIPPAQQRQQPARISVALREQLRLPLLLPHHARRNLLGSAARYRHVGGRLGNLAHVGRGVEGGLFRGFAGWGFHGGYGLGFCELYGRGKWWGL